MLEVTASQEELKGRYANTIIVTVQERDVVIDFANLINSGSQKNSQLVSRLFLNHFTAQELADTLKNGLNKWEEVRFENPKKYS
jgi:hypothetical protein